VPQTVLEWVAVAVAVAVQGDELHASPTSNGQYELYLRKNVGNGRTEWYGDLPEGTHIRIGSSEALQRFWRTFDDICQTNKLRRVDAVWQDQQEAVAAAAVAANASATTAAPAAPASEPNAQAQAAAHA
jgi:hypothetical protein